MLDAVPSPEMLPAPKVRILAVLDTLAEPDTLALASCSNTASTLALPVAEASPECTFVAVLDTLPAPATLASPLNL